MRVEAFVASTLHLAHADLTDARLLATHGRRNSAYFLEQAAEKVLIAVLTTEGKHGGIRHRLSEMADLLPDANPLKYPLREVAMLEEYATTFRYATEGGRIHRGLTPERFVDLADKVDSLLQRVAAHLGVDLANRDAIAQKVTPIR